MANKVAQTVNNQAPGSTYSGDAALLPFYLAHGYVYDDTSTTNKVNNTDTTPANDPTLAVNRENPTTGPYVADYQFGTDDALAARVTNLTFPGPGDWLQALPAAGGTVVIVKGDNFIGATGVTFGGTAGTNFSVVDADTIKVTTPAKAAGTYDVVVTKGAGNGTLVAGAKFA